MVELADAADSKSADRKVMGVRPPLPAPYKPLQMSVIDDNEWESIFVALHRRACFI